MIQLKQVISFRACINNHGLFAIRIKGFFRFTKRGFVFQVSRDLDFKGNEM